MLMHIIYTISLYDSTICRKGVIAPGPKVRMPKLGGPGKGKTHWEKTNTRVHFRFKAREWKNESTFSPDKQIRLLICCDGE